MSVYIKGFSPPNNCCACPLRLAWCRERIYMVTRPERCPLVPVPPHGRLIDADALVMENYTQYGAIDALALEAIKAAPTILEAEDMFDAVMQLPWGEVYEPLAIVKAEEGE